ncbi:MAG: hypothetical protein CVU43_16575 [Chloroflexi bacterium HGW-Chloroflexi-5]|nr:MAG: hypothetical protein CVU43_16575 [Chloroflexi bacterium HGW-Chloroflexi-5]
MKIKAQVFKVLTHPARFAILEFLRDGEHCVCHMEAHLGFPQSYISQQLSILREAGVIHNHRDGWNNYYRVSDGCNVSNDWYRKTPHYPCGTLRMPTMFHSQGNLETKKKRNYSGKRDKRR